MIRQIFACAMLMLTSAAVFAAPDDLFALCPSDEGMGLIVASLREDAVQGGLTEESIRNAAESRLRTAGIYDPKATPSLYVNVNVGRPEKGSGHFPFYSIRVTYSRPLLDDRILDEIGTLSVVEESDGTLPDLNGLLQSTRFPDGSALHDLQLPTVRTLINWNRQIGYGTTWGFATTWDSGVAGQGDSSYILSSLSRLLDKFLVEYLRVRDSKACQGLRRRRVPE